MLFSDSQRTFARALTGIAYANPFDQQAVQRLEETAASADIAVPVDTESVARDRLPDRPRMPLLLGKARALLKQLRPKLKRNVTQADFTLYEDLCLLELYFRFRGSFQRLLDESTQASVGKPLKVEFFREYQGLFQQALTSVGSQLNPAHLFACHFQIRRAYDLIYSHVFGESRQMQRLRADIWYSVFTHDMRRYRGTLFDRMHEISTLITGESGTGKELVARAVGLSRYVAFEPKTSQFVESISGAFHPVNMAALSSQLIESELFGHSKGAFTGAIKDRQGWFEICRRSHSVFLDEIGELESALQVKLLRVLQSRTFERIGETQARRFEGKVISATNRNLDDEIQAGRFRADVYYRLCADRIHTPSLTEQIQNQPDELEGIIRHLSQRICPEEWDSVARDSITWIGNHLPEDYSWPGNFRELEQCVRNILVRKEYRPLREHGRDSSDRIFAELNAVNWTVDELVTWYCNLAYRHTGSYVAAAKKLGLDRRTVKQRVHDDGTAKRDSRK